MAFEPTNAADDMTLTVPSWTIDKCGDIKRSLSTRANNARREGEISRSELSDMAYLYDVVNEAESELRYSRDLPAPAPMPSWVARHLNAG